jgi:hypothetical protein
MIDFSSLPAKAQAHLASVSKAVSGVLPVEVKKWKHHTRNLVANGGEPEVINDVKKWSGKGCVYLYVLTIASGVSDPSDLIGAYTNARTSEKGTRAYARLNKPSKCIYVGSSEKVHQRLKEHLGFGAKGTYSLHLACWINPFDLEIEFECARYSVGTDPKAVQALEDALWSELSPMFGRQGPR